MQCPTSGAQKTLVGDLLGQRVFERVHRAFGSAAVVDKLEPLQLGQRRPQVRPVLRDLFQQPQREFPAQHRCRLQRPLRFLWQAVNTRSKYALDRVRQGLCSAQRPLRFERKGKLFQE